MEKKFTFESTPKKEGEPHVLGSLESLKKLGVTIEADPMRVRDAYLVKFPFEGGITTIRVLFNDYSGAGLVITNMTTLPDNQKGQGFGSKAVQQLLGWAKSNNVTNIRAVQVQKLSERFWGRNGFIKDSGSNECNDFVYRDGSL